MDQELLKEIEALRTKLEAQSQASTLRAQELALSGARGSKGAEMAHEDARGALYFAASTALEALSRFEAATQARAMADVARKAA